MKVKLIVPKNKTIDVFMIHRMLCFNYYNSKGSDDVVVETSLYIDGKLKDIIKQKQIGTNSAETPSFDILYYYLINEYDEFEGDVWQEMNDGTYESVEIEIDCNAHVVL